MSDLAVTAGSVLLFVYLMFRWFLFCAHNSFAFPKMQYVDKGNIKVTHGLLWRRNQVFAPHVTLWRDIKTGDSVSLGQELQISDFIGKQRFLKNRREAS